MPPNLHGKRSGTSRIGHEPSFHKNQVISSQRSRIIRGGETRKGLHNFAQLKKEVLDRSVSQDWEVARKEWSLIDLYQEDDGTCPCGHSPITDRCVIQNKHNLKEMIVGNVCVHRFNKKTGEKSKKVFQGFRTIIRDLSARANQEFLKYARKKDFITSGEKIMYEKIPDKNYRDEIQSKTMEYLNMRMIRKWNAKKPKPKACSGCSLEKMNLVLRRVSDETETNTYKLAYKCKGCQNEVNFKEEKNPEADDETYEAQEDEESEQDEEDGMEGLVDENEEDEGGEEDGEYEEGEDRDEDDSYSEIPGDENVNFHEPTYDEDGEMVY